MRKGGVEKRGKMECDKSGEVLFGMGVPCDPLRINFPASSIQDRCHARFAGMKSWSVELSVTVSLDCHDAIMISVNGIMATWCRSQFAFVFCPPSPLLFHY